MTAHLLGGCCVYLENEQITINGIRIYGIPWVFEKKTEDISRVYSDIPTNTDILITHAPPYGYGDVMGSTIDEKGKTSTPGAHSGQLSLCKAVHNVQPKFHLFGHAHEGYGCYSNGNTTFINAATCTRNLIPSRNPVVFDYNLEESSNPT